MLNPNNNRVEYGKLLTPPEGFKLDFAVGTTYSLDLDALLGACISLGLYEETDSEIKDNLIYMLEALRATSEKVALFCEGAQIKVPNKPSKLFMLLEKIVFPVHTNKKKGIANYPSFHPKFWLIKYFNGQESIYRVIVLSRNLTFDRSWDVVFSMDGYSIKEENEKNEPLCDFLEYLRLNLPDNEYGKQKNNQIKKMIRDIPYVNFDLSEKEFEDYEFIPHGVPDRNDKNLLWDFSETPLFKNNHDELLVISPFLSNDIVKALNDSAFYNDGMNDYTLITRMQALGNLKPEDVSNFDFFVLKDLIVDGEDYVAQEESFSDLVKYDIHAKLYITRRYSDVHMYLGSLNASHNAIFGNIEFMVHIKCKNRYLNPDTLRNDLFTDEPYSLENPFQLVKLNSISKDEEEEKNSYLEQIIKIIDRASPEAIVIPEGEYFSISITFKRELPEGQITIRPLMSNKVEQLAEKIIFNDLSLMQLSEFYEISVIEDNVTASRIIKINTNEIPANRERELVNSIISDKDSFYRYIAFILDDSALLGALDMLETEDAKKKYKHHAVTLAPAIYEKLLKAIATNPEKLNGIEYIIKSVTKEGVIPEEFESLYKTVKRVMK